MVVFGEKITVGHCIVLISCSPIMVLPEPGGATM